MSGAYEENAHVISLDAEADHSGDNEGLNRFVVISDQIPNGFALSGAAGAAIGILSNKPVEGSPGRIIIGGISPLELGGSVEAGDRLASDADGRGVGSGGNPARAVALAGGVEGEIIPALVILT